MPLPGILLVVLFSGVQRRGRHIFHVRPFPEEHTELGEGVVSTGKKSRQGKRSRLGPSVLTAWCLLIRACSACRLACVVTWFEGKRAHKNII